MISRRISFLGAALAAAFAAGCATQPGQSPGAPGLFDPDPANTFERRIQDAASVAPIHPASVQLVTDNDEAFKAKINLVERASQSLDLVYYIYGDDYSSSRMSEALIAAAKRGVKVRLLVDYATNYARLDLFGYLESQGGGNLEVRFYGRPSRNIVRNAAYMTLGCGRADPPPGDNCSAERMAKIDLLFDGERINGESAERRNISNVNTGASGLFLSGLYAKRPDIMALAVQQGQTLDRKAMTDALATAAPIGREDLRQVGRSFWRASTGNAFARVQGQVALMFAFAAYGDRLNPLVKQMEAFMPPARDMGPETVRDWDHLSDFTHHKLLLADDRWLTMGGRNVEDSYHMRLNKLSDKYVFMDTDVVVDLSDAGGEGRAVGYSFDGLWEFDRMVATLKEVRAHAPNDFVANAEVLKTVTEQCSKRVSPTRRESCVATEFENRALPRAAREQKAGEAMARNAAVYAKEYAPTQPASHGPSFAAEGKSLLAYLENLPFDPDTNEPDRVRFYGATAGEPQGSAKGIHAAWFDLLTRACDGASAQHPKRVIFHNAYFFPSADTFAQLQKLWSGQTDCSNVTVTVLTNSIETTDLNVVNIFARHSTKAFLERVGPAAAKGPKFQYFEYTRPAGADKASSLHTKLTLVGDDLIVGSANADVRSLMMDSNNAMLIRGSDGLRRQYLEWLDGLLADRGKVREVTPSLIGTPRETMVKEDMATLDAIAAKYRAERFLDDAQEATVKKRFAELLDAAYVLTRQALDPSAPESERRNAQQTFNDLFKPI